MDFTGIMDALKQLNILDASLYSSAIMLALLVRFVRAYGGADIFAPKGATEYQLAIARNEFTLLLGGVLGFAGAFLTLLGTSRPLGFVAMQGFALVAAVLVVEFALRKAGDKVGWIPSDGQFTAPPPAEKPVIVQPPQETKP